MAANDILNTIQGPDDIKALNDKECQELSHELRETIIDRVSQNGGHLSSNLGVVELTVALLSVFSPPNDQIVWDVGHQSYSYKLLTGRQKEFETLRQFDGMSGFPRPSESEYDAFGTGHSSTSVSAALGLLRAKKLQGDDGHVVAIIGDGSLTGGMAYEGLNDTGHLGENLIVILNDNQMSIDKNVGALSKHLLSFRSSRAYIRAKNKMEKILLHTPIIGRPVFRFLRMIKTWIRITLRRNNPVIFEDLGFKYFGPFNGHDIPLLKKKLEMAKSMNEPVLVHIITQKGRGYTNAEKNPSLYHGISSFDRKKGIQVDPNKKTFTDAFSDAIVKEGREDKRVVAVCAAMMSSTGLSEFRKEMKLRFFDVGIAEEHAVTMAAGMAKNGMIPVVALYSTFIQRSIDQILHDVCLMNLHVVFAIDRAGIVGADGPTHQGIYEMAFMNTMPNIMLFSPMNYAELGHMLHYAITEARGPIAIRYPRGAEPEILSSIPTVPGIAPRSIREGNQVAIISIGVMAKEALEAASILENRGISCQVIDLRCAKPIMWDFLLPLLTSVKVIATIEDGVKEFGIGSGLIIELARRIPNIPARNMLSFGIEDAPLKAGKREELIRFEKMNADSIANAMEKHFLENNN